ncbi:hypothetical protein EBZ80_05870 [bacterium]|nr:hypothetical protein [bacterium]
MKPSTLILIIFVSSWMGVAVQSLAMVLAVAWVIGIYSSTGKLPFIEHFHQSKWCQWAMFIGLAWLCLGLVVSILNPRTSSVWPDFVPAYLWWVLGPFFFPLLAEGWCGLDSIEKSRLRKMFLVAFWTILISVCLICASQFWIGWKLQGTEIISAEKRARGLFSHPLSLAYILLLYVPLAAGALVRDLRSMKAWALVLALLFLIFVSSSRTVQAVVAGLAAVFVLFGLKGRHRVVGVIGGVFLTTLTICTDNPLRQRVISTIEQKEDRQQNQYADDRIAFWAVHWDMFKEKPMFGHGLSYKQDYLDRYYEAHGLGELKKKYPAHNMFLQLMVNTGVAGLMLWLARVMVDVTACVTLIRGVGTLRGGRGGAGSRAWVGWTGIATIVAILVAGLTQNAFQDSAVRFHWTILEGVLLWFTSRQEVSNAQPQEALPA